ncbi:MAG: hypothetical protein HN392_07445 [Anaerolineae bacterium]|jgi:hypothetical protein|nr:hypothetical protein [Anaerolineae bacterium]MBT7073860.1 hypothetical protein [Anaerolineae bacterium]MBT7782598.1 hypothetical protein [Anaerolineae bacterium]
MQKNLSAFSKFFAIIFAILFVLALVTTLFLYNLEQDAFNAETYKNALYSEGIYERLPAVLGDQLVLLMGVDHCAENPVSCETEYRSAELETCLLDALGRESYRALSNNERPLSEAENERIAPCYEEHGYPKTNEGEKELLATLTKNLTAKDWENFILAIIPPKELETISEEILDEIFEYLNGNSDIAQISFKKIKKRLMGEGGVDAVIMLIEAQPACTPADLLKIASQELAVCRPPEIIMPALKPIIEFQLKIAAERIPDQKIILENNNGSLFEAQSIRVLMRLSPLLPIVLLFMITLLVVRDLRSWLRWWGIPLLISGIIGLIMSLITAPLVRTLLSVPLVSGAPMEISSSVIELLYNLAESIVHGLVENIVLYALIFTVLGLIMTIASAFIKKTQESAEII